MASARDIKRRIKSVKNTQQITKAMKMVSAAKLRKAQQAVMAVRPFTRKIEDIISHLGGANISHPLLTPREEVKRVGYLVIGSDRGLCGGFNTNLHRFLEQTLAKEEREYALIVLGRRVRDYCQRRNKHIDYYYTEIADNPSYYQARDLAKLLTDEYLAHNYDEVYIVYSEFRSVISQTPKIKKLLPLTYERDGEGSMFRETEYIFEPSPEIILQTIIPQYIDIDVYWALQEAKASEHGARMTAMNSATDNATEIIGKLTLSLNRARQAAITTEITEIVSGAEALS